VCPDGSSPCHGSFSVSVSQSFTNSFGVTAGETAGEDLIEDVMESIMFSYMYTYTKGKTEMVSQEVNYPAGEHGDIIFTPYTECTTGMFTGTCNSGIPTNKQGTVCIPAKNEQGEQAGVFSFVQLSP
jgi:hypothetical protein